MISFEDDLKSFCGDIFIKIMHISAKASGGNDKQICRLGIHTSYLSNVDDQFIAKFDTFTVDPCSIRKEKQKEYEGFRLKFVFKKACQNSNCLIEKGNQ